MLFFPTLIFSHYMRDNASPELFYTCTLFYCLILLLLETLNALLATVKLEGDRGWRQQEHGLMISAWICNIYCTHYGKDLCHDIINNHIVTFSTVKSVPICSYYVYLDCQCIKQLGFAQMRWKMWSKLRSRQSSSLFPLFLPPAVCFGSFLFIGNIIKCT